MVTRDFKHTKTGNCFDSWVRYSCKRCGPDVLCYACHDHDETRGRCSVCAPCQMCEVDRIAFCVERMKRDRDLLDGRD